MDEVAPAETTPHLNPYGLRICETPSAGRGVFATRPISGNTVIEISPVLLFSAEEYEHYGRYTVLDSYTFVWEKSTSGITMALALGLGSLFNHHGTQANVSYELDRAAQAIRYRSVRSIGVGEELCICYGAGRMWWESPSQEVVHTPVSESKECDLFGQMDLYDPPQIEPTTETAKGMPLRAPVDPSYAAPLWRVTASPDPHTMELETALAWAMDIRPQTCSSVVRILQGLIKDGAVRTGDKYPMRHLRSFRKAADVTRIMQNGATMHADAANDMLAMLVALHDAHPDADALSATLASALESLEIDVHLYLVRVPTGPAPTRARLAEWSEVWPCTFLPPGAGLRTNNAVPGSDAARAATLVDRVADACLWSSPELVRPVREAFERCLRTAAAARARGELGIGVYVTSRVYGTESTVATTSFIDIDANDTRTSEAHPLRHAVPNAVRKVAALRADHQNDAQDIANGQDYLLTGLTLFVTHEPCPFCAMALIHSRVRAVYFLYPSPASGAFCGARNGVHGRPTILGTEDGGPFAVHEQSGLNHHYDVWRWVNPADFGMPTDVRLLYDI